MAIMSQPIAGRIFLVLMLAILGYGVEPIDSATKRWLNEREVVRKERRVLTQGAIADRRVRAEKAAKILVDLIAKARDNRVPGQDAALSALLVGIGSIDEQPVAGLEALLNDLPSEPVTAETKAIKAWDKVLAEKRALMTRPTEQLGEKALKMNVLGIAHDCLEQVFLITPDHAGLRKNLRQVKLDDRWYGPRDQETARSGLRWDNTFGWIIPADRERYTKGGFFDPITRIWTTLVAVDAEHSQRDTPWVVQTEHLEIRGTAHYADLIDTANRLEQFYQSIFGAYSGFFAGKKGQPNDMKLIFGLLDHPRLVLNIARNEADYQQSLPPGVDAGWSAGMFIPSVGASFFYAGQKEVVYHEFTHQILHQFTGMNRAPVWAVEGVAVYTQAPVFEQGRMVLGHIAGNYHLVGHLKRLKQGKHMPIGRLLALEDHAVWGRTNDPGPQYAAAGMFVQFCMEAEDQRYREDFIDYLRDAYRGETNERKIWLYCGMDQEGLEKAYEAWLATIATEPLPK